MVFPTTTTKSLQLCPTLCDPIDGSPPGSAVLGILQARTLKWVAISFSNAWKWKLKVKSFSRIWLLATPWTAAYQAPPSMGFSRQEYWSGVPLPSPVVFPTFFNLSLNFAIRISWLEPQSAPGLVFSWFYRACSSLATKNIINLISVLTIWWCPCVESSLVLLEEGVCYDQCIFLAKLY